MRKNILGRKKLLSVISVLLVIILIAPVASISAEEREINEEPKDGPLTKTFIFCRDITISSDSKGLIDGSTPVLYWRSNGDTEVYIKGLIGGEYENTATDPLTGIFIFFIGDTNEDPFYIHGVALLCLFS